MDLLEKIIICNKDRDEIISIIMEKNGYKKVSCNDSLFWLKNGRYYHVIFEMYENKFVFTMEIVPSNFCDTLQETFNAISL